MTRRQKRKTPPPSPLDGLSLNSITMSQGGELEVEFELPAKQEGACWEVHSTGTRTLDLDEDGELAEACRAVFRLVRDRLAEPDAEREAVDCDRCRDATCCRSYNVLLRAEDEERLAAGLGLSRAEFVERFTAPAADWTGDFARQLACDEDEDGEEKCVFLEETQAGLWRCSVYEHRPRICRDFDMETCRDFIPIDDLAPKDESSASSGDRPRR